MAIVQERGKPPHLKLPNFEPLPPDKWQNRMINSFLKPFFYLFFTLITSIIIIPVFTIFENLQSRSRSQRGESNHANRSSYTMDGQPVEQRPGSLQHFLQGYGSTYGGQGAKARRPGSASRM